MNLNRNPECVVFIATDSNVYRNYYGLKKVKSEVVLCFGVNSKEAIFRPAPRIVISEFDVYKLNGANLHLNYSVWVGYENRLFLQYYWIHWLLNLLLVHDFVHSLVWILSSLKTSTSLLLLAFTLANILSKTLLALNNLRILILRWCVLIFFFLLRTLDWERLRLQVTRIFVGEGLRRIGNFILGLDLWATSKS